jgi:hypothetical protein
MSANREKFYTVSARLVFSSIIVVLIVALILGASVAINKGPIFPILGLGATTSIVTTTIPGQPPVVIGATCASSYPYRCLNANYNYTTGNLTVAISQKTGYNWTAVTVRFVPSNTVYSHGVPELSWSPPEAVNVTGGLLSNATKYVNIPITSGPIAVGTVITGSIWAKYQLQVGEQVSYANISSAVITVSR